MSYEKEIQNILKECGYYSGKIDGIIGKKTYNAIKKLVYDIGISDVTERKPKYKLSKKSISKLHGVHCDLQRVVKRAIKISECDFLVGEGMRSIKRQRELVGRGASKTMNSRHLTGHAVDLIALDENGNVTWEWEKYHIISDAMKKAAKLENVKITWGGDWKRFKDGVHYQLDWKIYPK